jgi:hypothetical protein
MVMVADARDLPADQRDAAFDKVVTPASGPDDAKTLDLLLALRDGQAGIEASRVRRSASLV